MKYIPASEVERKFDPTDSDRCMGLAYASLFLTNWLSHALTMSGVEKALGRDMMCNLRVGIMDVAKYLRVADDALLASAVELPEPGLREIRLAVEAIKALAVSIHRRVPGESQSEDDSREIVSIADRILTLARPASDDKLRKALRHVKDHAHMSPETERIVDAALRKEGA